MDTSTHFVMGVGLFGLSHIDPTITSQPETATAVLAATIIGSQLPDTDGFYRLKGPAAYIRNHRGWTHSLPMVLIWPLLLTFILSLFFPTANKTHIFLWAFIAVCIHIFIDLFNTYGTQAFRPFSSQWISWNIINIFDPFIFTIHVLGFLLWSFTSLTPALIFSSVYVVLIGYFLWRTWVHHRLTEWVREHLNTEGRVTLTPTMRWSVWNVIIEEDGEVKIGEIHYPQLVWTGCLTTGALNHPAVLKSTQAEAIYAFLSFTSYGYPLVFERSFGYEVRWLDVRYHYKKHFPFVAVAFLDHEYNIHYSFVGFMGEQQLKRRLQKFEKMVVKEKDV